MRNKFIVAIGGHAYKTIPNADLYIDAYDNSEYPDDKLRIRSEIIVDKLFEHRLRDALSNRVFLHIASKRYIPEARNLWLTEKSSRRDSDIHWILKARTPSSTS